MIKFICKHWDYHLRLERIAETFTRTETECSLRSESTIVKRCQDCGTTITTTSINETVVTPSGE